MEDKKKKKSMGEKLRSAIMRGTGAEKVKSGFAGEGGMSMEDRVAASGGGPRLAPNKRAQFETQGIFDQGKYDRYMAKKKKK